MKLSVIAGAEIPANDHTCADRKAIEEKDGHVCNHRRRTDGCERFLPDEIADDDRVYGVIHHLEDIPEHKRQGKFQDQTRNITLCHIFGGCFRQNSLLIKAQYLYQRSVRINPFPTISYAAFILKHWYRQTDFKYLGSVRILAKIKPSGKAITRNIARISQSAPTLISPMPKL